MFPTGHVFIDGWKNGWQGWKLVYISAIKVKPVRLWNVKLWVKPILLAAEDSYRGHVSGKFVCKIDFEAVVNETVNHCDVIQ